MNHRIFLVEDHDDVRATLRQFLGAQSGFEVCGAAATAEQALEDLVGLEVDLVLVDTSLPGMDGIELVGLLTEQRPDLPCLMYSGHGQANHVERALAAGARGYALKGQPRELPEAVREVLAGRSYLSPVLRASRGEG